MHEFELIKNYFSKISKKNKSALNLNDDIFFDKSKRLAISIDTYVEKVHFFVQIDGRIIYLCFFLPRS